MNKTSYTSAKGSVKPSPDIIKIRLRNWVEKRNICPPKKTIKTMSKNAGGYMGIQIGKLGPAVGSMWKGKNVYRSYNPFVKPPPHTPGQQEQRASLSSRTGICYPTSMAKFSDLSNLARVFSPG